MNNKNDSIIKQVNKELGSICGMTLKEYHDIHNKVKFPVFLSKSLTSKSIDCLDLTASTTNVLKRSGIHTIGDLAENSSRLQVDDETTREIMYALFLHQFADLEPGNRRRYMNRIVQINGTSKNRINAISKIRVIDNAKNR